MNSYDRRGAILFAPRHHHQNGTATVTHRPVFYVCSYFLRTHTHTQAAYTAFTSSFWSGTLIQARHMRLERLFSEVSWDLKESRTGKEWDPSALASLSFISCCIHAKCFLLLVCDLLDASPFSSDMIDWPSFLTANTEEEWKSFRWQLSHSLIQLHRGVMKEYGDSNTGRSKWKNAA